MFTAKLYVDRALTENEDHFSVSQSKMKDTIRTVEFKLEVARWQPTGQKQLANWLLNYMVFKHFKISCYLLKVN